MELSQKIKEDKNIPLTMDGLTALPGIGRKSANVIMRESGIKAEGVIVDLHTEDERFPPAVFHFGTRITVNDVV